MKLNTKHIAYIILIVKIDLLSSRFSFMLITVETVELILSL